LRLAHRIRHGWEAFAARTGLRGLPPVLAAIAVLAAGVLFPFVPRVDALPPQLAPSLANSRVGRFLRAHPDIPEAGPSGTVRTPRPAFYWPEREGADSYSFRLYRADGTPQASADGLKTVFTLIPPPGALAPGEYRFEVKAVVKGEAQAWREKAFTVRPAPEDLAKLTHAMGMDLTPAEGAYVLLGYYADVGSPDDVISAFLQWKAARGEAATVGKGPAAAWLKSLAG
jgi:hypothetical protein